MEEAHAIQKNNTWCIPQTDMKDLKTCMKGLTRMLVPTIGPILVSCIIGAIQIAASLAFVWVSKALVDIASGASGKDLGTHVVLMIVIMLVQLIGRLGANWWEGWFTTKSAIQMRRHYFNHVMRSEWTGRDSFHSADTINRLEEDIRVVNDLICTRVPACFITVCQFIAAAIYMFTLQPALLWVLVILMPVAVIGSKMFFKTIRTLTAKIRALDSELQGHMQENLQNRILVKTMAGMARVMERMASLQDSIFGNTVKRMNYNAVARGFMGFGFSAGYCAAFLWGIFGIRSGAITFGTMTAFLQLVGQIQRPIADISRHIPAFIHSLTSVERLMELEDQPLEKENGSIRLDGVPGIRVSGMGFRYPEQKEPVFTAFSHTFEPGSVTAIMGATGSGKSTLTRLILALLKPADGSIEIFDGSHCVPVCADTRCNFMYVPQGNSLMSGTIRENLLMADPEASEARLKEALHLAVADFVLDLPEGLDSRCSEKGSGLSEGQAQRIAIARALLQEGGVLILDEATSALDSETERTLIDRLSAHYSGNKTILWVTHREAVTQFAGSILRIGNH